MFVRVWWRARGKPRGVYNKETGTLVVHDKDESEIRSQLVEEGFPIRFTQYVGDCDELASVLKIPLESLIRENENKELEGQVTIPSSGIVSETENIARHYTE